MTKAIIRKAILEFKEYSALTVQNRGGWKFYWQFDMFWCLLKYGARPIDYYRFEFYRFNRFERNRYFTFFRYKNIASKLIKSGAIFADKVKEYDRYTDFIKRKWMATQGASKETLAEFIENHGPCIAKPNRGEQGKGIFLVSSESIKRDTGLIDRLFSENYVLEQKLKNCSEFNLINESSLNTLRVYTIFGNDGKPHVLNMMLRVGKSGSDVDNWGAGGIGYEINLEDGIIHGYGVDKQGNKYIKHPGTNLVMLGFKIPQYSEILRVVKELCLVDTQAKLVGWDIALTPQGPELIEMNCPAGHDFLQAFGTPYYDRIKELW